MTARSPLAAASDRHDWAVVGWASGSGCGLGRGPVPGLHRWSRSPNELPRRAAPRCEVQHPERACGVPEPARHWCTPTGLPAANSEPLVHFSTGVRKVQIGASRPFLANGL
jgi:hypothetical protein